MVLRSPFPVRRTLGRTVLRNPPKNLMSLPQIRGIFVHAGFSSHFCRPGGPSVASPIEGSCRSQRVGCRGSDRALAMMGLREPPEFNQTLGSFKENPAGGCLKNGDLHCPQDTFGLI